MFEEQAVDLVGNLVDRVRAEGREETLLDFVRNLLRMGSTADFISEATGLPRAEVERLAAEMR